MNQLDPKVPVSPEEKDKNIQRIADEIRRAKIIQDVEGMPKPVPEPERQTSDDPAVWERQPDGSLKKVA